MAYEKGTWVKVVYNETPTKVNIKKGRLFDEGIFYRVVGDRSDSLVRKGNIISITKKNIIGEVR